MKENILKFFLRIFGLKFVTVGIPEIIRNKEGEILLGKRSEGHLLYAGYWGLPGGLMDYGETPEETCKREVKEELGIEVKVQKRSKEIYNVMPSKESNIQSINIPFYCKIVSGNPNPKDETKEVRWFKPSEIKKMNLAYTHKEILKNEGLI